MRLFELHAGRRHHSMRSNGARFMRVAARNIGRRFSICSSMRTRRGQRTRPSWSCSFREGTLIIMTNRQSRIPMSAAQRGKISHCKAFSRVSSCMGCKASITIAPAKNCGFLRTFRSKRWPPSAGRVRKNHYLKNYKPAKVPMTGENFLTAFSKGRSNPNNSGHS